MLKTPEHGVFSPNIDNPQNGDTLVYNSTSGKWENGSGGGGGGAVKLNVTHTTSGNNDVYTLDKTWNEIKSLLEAGTQVMIYGEGTGPFEGAYAQFMVTYVSEFEGEYSIYDVASGFMNYETAVIGAGNDAYFATDSANGYPSITVSNNHNAV